MREVPDVTLRLPWNLADEIMAQQTEYLSKRDSFIVAVPIPRAVDAAVALRADL